MQFGTNKKILSTLMSAIDFIFNGAPRHFIKYNDAGYGFDRGSIIENDDHILIDKDISALTNDMNVRWLETNTMTVATLGITNTPFSNTFNSFLALNNTTKEIENTDVNSILPEDTSYSREYTLSIDSSYYGSGLCEYTLPNSIDSMSISPALVSSGLAANGVYQIYFYNKTYQTLLFKFDYIVSNATRGLFKYTSYSSGFGGDITNFNISTGVIKFTTLNNTVDKNLQLLIVSKLITKLEP